VACFFLPPNDGFFIDSTRSKHEFLNLCSAAGNAHIIQNDSFPFLWKIKKITSSVPLSPEWDTIIQKGIHLPSYCDLCTERLVSITGGCNPCAFQSTTEDLDFSLQNLLFSLKENGYYEVDAAMFQKELAVLKKLS
jgi:hypothetical protein